jgi:hypothetical protein
MTIFRTATLPHSHRIDSRGRRSRSRGDVPEAGLGERAGLVRRASARWIGLGASVVSTAASRLRISALGGCPSSIRAIVDGSVRMIAASCVWLSPRLARWSATRVPYTVLPSVRLFWEGAKRRPALPRSDSELVRSVGVLLPALRPPALLRFVRLSFNPLRKSPPKTLLEKFH